MKLLTDGWGEVMIRQLKDYLPWEVVCLNKDLLKKKSFDGSELQNAKIMRKTMQEEEFSIIHCNNWLDIPLCSLDKAKVNIYESHSIHFGLDLINTYYDLETWGKRLSGVFVHFIYKFFFWLKIRWYDIYFVSIPSVLPYARKFRKDALWLPNPIDFRLFEKPKEVLELDTNFINIFNPTAWRIQKNPQKAWDVIDRICEKYGKKVKIYILKHSGSDYKKYRQYIEKYNEQIIWLPLMPREELARYFCADWDLVIGSLWPADDYAMLNMIELECMASKAPIVARDGFEILKEYPIERIEELSLRIVEEKDFRKEYVEKNYAYVKKVHSAESVAKLYQEIIERKLAEKGLVSHV